MSTLSINDFFPSPWLKADDIPDDEDLVFTVQSLDWEAIGFEKESKPVMTFNETSKKLVLNKTNGKTLESLFGKNVTNFFGKKISLYKKLVEFQGKASMGVRIRPEAPNNAVESEPATEEQINLVLGQAEAPL
jgi:hypothetical protein